MSEFLLVRLEGPLQAWGDVAYDTLRPTRPFPSRSALAGLLASALGWTYREAAKTTALQDGLQYAVRADRQGVVVTDFQTAELATVDRGWTRWGIERRDIGNVTRTIAVQGRAPRLSATQILRKGYLADASFLAAVAVAADAPAGLDALEAALRCPARPLFLGRRSCLPSRPLFEGRVAAASAYTALADGLTHAVPCWYGRGDGPERQGASRDVWDRRDFTTNRFEGARTVIRGLVGPGDAHV